MEDASRTNELGRGRYENPEPAYESAEPEQASKVSKREAESGSAISIRYT